MWSRRVCLDEGLMMGSMIPQINWAVNKNFKVIVFNPNLRRDEKH